MNTFKYTHTSNNNLRQNPAHTFALNHSLMIYRSNALYTFIPKNGCSSLRVSLAIKNGCIRSQEDFNWIHSNNDTFRATLKEAILTDYSFVILRCPYRRLVSVFLDKFILRSPDAWGYYDLIERKTELNQLTFRQFIESLSKPAIKNSNIHWRPQVQFLLFDEYTDYFCLENFDKAKTVLKEKIGLDLVDARPLTKHGLDNLTKLTEDKFCDTPLEALEDLKRQGKTPDYQAMYDEELIAIVKKAYQADLTEYEKRFGEENLLFKK